ncbi:MAG: hypothetical protein AAF702_21695 [Chloroflexota bacterium]
MPNPALDIPHVLDDPPSYHKKLLEYGERPYWTLDGSRVAFIESNYGDVCEIEVESGQIRHLTRGLGDHHSFLRVLVLSNGDYLLVGPKKFIDRETSRKSDSELWVLDKNLKRPPKPLGRRCFEGLGVSTLTPKISYAVSGRHDPKLPDLDSYECRVADIIYGDDGPELGEARVIYRIDGGHRPEPQDFRHDDTEVIIAEYVTDPIKRAGNRDHYCVVKGIMIETGEVRTYIDEPCVHNECEGIFPDHEHICLESGCDGPYDHHTNDLWKLKLDGTGRRVRMTEVYNRPPWRCTNSNVSPDSRWLAFMVTLRTDEPGYGRGLGLMDLEAWENSSKSQEWGTP